MRGSRSGTPFGLIVLALALAPATRAQPPAPDAWGRPELSLALGVGGSASCRRDPLTGAAASACLAAGLLAEQGLGLGPFVTAGLREFGWLESGLVGWGAAAELRLNLPLGPVQLFAVGGAGPGGLRQSDAGLVRETGVGLYLHGGLGARLMGENRGTWVELKLEGQRWSGQDSIGTSGLSPHTALSQPYFSLGFGFVPGSWSTN